MRGRVRKVAYKATERGSIAFQKRIAKRPDAQIEFFDSDDFPWVREVEARWDDIRAELDALLVKVDQIPNFQDVQQEQRALTEGDDWKVFIFDMYGAKYDHNLAKCPKTAEALQLIPGMSSAMFSILRSGKHIPPHCGPWKGVLRYHLALKTPENESLCRIRVGSQTRSWTNGTSLIFDDTFEHEVWNDSDETRVVLFVDFLRDLPPQLAIPNRLFMWSIQASVFIQCALRNLEGWEETLNLF
jgi:aspartyl/asparaginyl beta-hydroxylase (cupin superfamily)